MEILQWIVSTLAGMAVGIGYARMQYNRPRRKAEKALDEILADAGRKFVPPPAPPRGCGGHHRLRFVRIAHNGYKTTYDLYRCTHCNKAVLMPRHRYATAADQPIRSVGP